MSSHQVSNPEYVTEQTTERTKHGYVNEEIITESSIRNHKINNNAVAYSSKLAFNKKSHAVISQIYALQGIYTKEYNSTYLQNQPNSKSQI